LKALGSCVLTYRYCRLIWISNIFRPDLLARVIVGILGFSGQMRCLGYSVVSLHPIHGWIGRSFSRRSYFAQVAPSTTRFDLCGSPKHSFIPSVVIPRDETMRARRAETRRNQTIINLNVNTTTPAPSCFPAPIWNYCAHK
jgi:hypothetical protein